ncbi:MAG: preprotein translocase subunit YajC [Treponema sp.]|jgi:preprotein translocase subunit YajC|nr:preprotein translocase subunit YajC [Treponema sp.]
MNTFVFSLLLGAPQGGAGTAGTGNLVSAFLPFILIIAIFYFIIIRPQNKKQKETQRMLSALKKGDRIVTIGGIHGVISTVRENSVVVKVDDNTKVEFSRSAISNVVEAGKAEKIEDKTEEKTADTTEGSKS